MNRSKVSKFNRTKIYTSLILTSFFYLSAIGFAQNATLEHSANCQSRSNQPRIELSDPEIRLADYRHFCQENIFGYESWQWRHKKSYSYKVDVNIYSQKTVAVRLASLKNGTILFKINCQAIKREYKR